MPDFAVICPGQGSQFPDMFELAVADVRAREVLERFSDALSVDLVAHARRGDDLFGNAYAQPALVALASATWAALAPDVPEPVAFAGYSVGEVSAWSCAGAWSPEQAAQVVQSRAACMDRYAPPDCGMLAVRGVLLEQMQAGRDVFVAIVNDADHAVLAGSRPALLQAEQALKAAGAWTRLLDVHVPSHTPLLQPAAEAFRLGLARVPLQRLSIPVLRGLDGARCWDQAACLEALPRAVAEPIRWVDCMHGLVESGARVVLELGPGRSLTKLCGDSGLSLRARSVNDFRSFGAATEWLRRQLDD